MKIPFLHFILLAVCCMSLLAYVKNNSERVYTIKHTQTEWLGELDTLYYLQQKIGYPLQRNESDQWIQVIERMRQRMFTQLQPQVMEADKKEQEANRKDSTKPKNK